MWFARSTRVTLKHTIADSVVVVVPVVAVLMTGGGSWWRCVVVCVLGRVVEDHRVQHGGVMVGTWCMCCVYKANVFRKQNYKRFGKGQSTKVGCKTNMLKQ